MKTRRRVEIQVEKREVSVFFQPSSGRTAPGEVSDAQAGRVPTIRPEACPTCGSTGLTPLAEVSRLARIDPHLLEREIQHGRMHLHCSPSGEWWICTASLSSS